MLLLSSVKAIFIKIKLHTGVVYLWPHEYACEICAQICIFWLHVQVCVYVEIRSVQDRLGSVGGSLGVISKGMYWMYCLGSYRLKQVKGNMQKKQCLWLLCLQTLLCYPKCFECIEAGTVWGAEGAPVLLLSNELSSAPFLCLSVRSELQPQSMCPANHAPLPLHPACQGSASGGADRLTRDPGLRGLQKIYHWTPLK